MMRKIFQHEHRTRTIMRLYVVKDVVKDVVKAFQPIFTHRCVFATFAVQETDVSWYNGGTSSADEVCIVCRPISSAETIVF